jgi:hypothetical protein
MKGLTMKTNFLTLLMALTLMIGGGLALTACEQEGPAEEMGESIDEGVEEMGDAAEEMGDEMN